MQINVRGGGYNPEVLLTLQLRRCARFGRVLSFYNCLDN